VLKWTYFGLVKGVGEECERIEEGLHSATGLIFASTVTTGLFNADLMGKPFLWNWALNFRTILGLDCITTGGKGRAAVCGGTERD